MLPIVSGCMWRTQTFADLNNQSVQSLCTKILMDIKYVAPNTEHPCLKPPKNICFRNQEIKSSHIEKNLYPQVVFIQQLQESPEQSSMPYKVKDLTYLS